MDCIMILWTVGFEVTEKSQCSASAAKFIDICLTDLDSITVSDSGVLACTRGRQWNMAQKFLLLNEKRKCVLWRHVTRGIIRQKDM